MIMNWKVSYSLVWLLGEKVERLVLVNPCEIGEEAERRAKHAKSILKKAKILKKMDWKGYDTLIGTTGIRATEYNV